MVGALRRPAVVGTLAGYIVSLAAAGSIHRHHVATRLATPHAEEVGTVEMPRRWSTRCAWSR